MNKSSGQLKQKQREKIAEWMYQAYKKKVQEGLSEEDALQLVFDQIEEAKIGFRRKGKENEKDTDRD